MFNQDTMKKLVGFEHIAKRNNNGILNNFDKFSR